MPLLIPTVNPFKSLLEKLFAPITVSWEFEDGIASVIAPSTSSPGAARFEVRVPGGDTNFYYAFAAILAICL